MSVLVTVLDNDDRINSDNIKDRLKTSLTRHPLAKNFQLLNATVYGKNINYELVVNITNSLIQMHVHHRTFH